MNYRQLINTVSLLLSFLLLLSKVEAANKKIKLKNVPEGVTIYGTDKDGKVYVANNNTISVPNNKIDWFSLYAVNSEGQLLGPVVTNNTSNARQFLSKKSFTANKINLKIGSLGSGNYITTNLASKYFKSSGVALADIPQFGLNSLAASSRTVKASAALDYDADRDGVVNGLDTDVDGDGISNSADDSNDIQGSELRALDEPSIDVPYTAMYLNIEQTVNWHKSGTLSNTDIDNTIAAENVFSVSFFFSPPNGADVESITGGYVECSTALEYCRPSSSGTPGTAVYSGFTEGDQSLPGQLWANLTASGREYSLEQFTLNGGYSAIAASIQPRVGINSFRPGDNYTINYTNADGDVVSRSTLTLPPYFLTVPAIRTYNTTSNDSADDQLVDYSASPIIGTNSNPIVLATSGDFSGKLRLVAYRLQRLATSDESAVDGSEYKDTGSLNYGVVINNNSGEYTCGELYSNLSSTLTELPSRGEGGGFRTDTGANIWPLVDGSSDYSPSSNADSTVVGNNTIAFTVDLASCLDRNGLTPGIHRVTLMAAGPTFRSGANRAAQIFYVDIP